MHNRIDTDCVYNTILLTYFCLLKALTLVIFLKHAMKFICFTQDLHTRFT